MIEQPAWQDVVNAAGGDAWAAGFNVADVGGGIKALLVQRDERVFTVGEIDHAIVSYTLDEWLGHTPQTEGEVSECANEQTALWKLRGAIEDTMAWQCGGCDAWMYTSNRPRIGRLQCAVCGDGGVDFRHADRHVGGE